MSNQGNFIIKSDCIFTATDTSPINGYVKVENDKISAVGQGEIPSNLLSADTKVYNYTGKTVSPGFVDVHCFFTGYVVRFLGCDLANCSSENEVIETAKKHMATISNDYPILGHNLKVKVSEELLNKEFGDRPVVLFMEGQETCAMNTSAIQKYNFNPNRCWPEAYVKIFPYILGDKKFIKPEFIKYMKMMNSHGITSIKEMGFDDFYTFTEVLEELEKENALTVRVNFMSQPVDKPMNIEYGKKMRDKFKGEFVRFSGYNQMTDGSVSEFNADIKKPYNNTDTCCKQNIDWKKLGDDTRSADENNFRFSLHCQGDAAIAKTLDIYETCKRDANGKMVNRHAITDLEFSDPQDLERMGKMGVIAEVYPQIQSIANREGKLKMIEEKIGLERGKNYWNRRKMQDSGVTISCGTDLPLLIDNIPESVYHAVGGFFPEGGEPFNTQNMLKTNELLKAWTHGGAYNLGDEKTLGTLEVGKKADIAVLSGNLFTTPIENIRELKVDMTVINGNIVYERE